MNYGTIEQEGEYDESGEQMTSSADSNARFPDISNFIEAKYVQNSYRLICESKQEFMKYILEVEKREKSEAGRMELDALKKSVRDEFTVYYSKFQILTKVIKELGDQQQQQQQKQVIKPQPQKQMSSILDKSFGSPGIGLNDQKQMSMFSTSNKSAFNKPIPNKYAL